MKKSLALLAVAASAAISSAAWADSVSDGIAKYREMLQDGNPAELFEMNGEELWTTKRGPKNASLEQCDLGKGPGVVKGAFVELPRYFADTGRVQDLESRLLTCMETLQGLDAAKIAKTKYNTGEQENLRDIATYVAGQSREMAFNLPQYRAEERAMYEVG